MWHEFRAEESSSCKLFDGCDTDKGEGAVVDDADKGAAEAGAAAPSWEGGRQAQAAPAVQSQAEGELKAGCDCKWANGNSCAPRSNDDSRCWGVCCSAFHSEHRR